MDQREHPPLNILILGGGIAGTAASLALNKFLPNRTRISLLEVREAPSNPVGGAVHLTPNALRALDTIGVLPIIKTRELGCDVGKIDLLDMHSGEPIASVDFRGPDGIGFGNPPHRGRRILRSDLLSALYETVAQHNNMTAKFGMQITDIQDNSSGVTLTLSDGSQISGDMLLGCDGIHSAVRSLRVDPERKATYTGVAVAIGFSPISEEQHQLLPMKDTALLSGRQGSLIFTFYNPRRNSVYLSAVMETPHVASRQGWKAKGADQEAVRKDIATRCRSGVPLVNHLLENASDWFLYPVSSLPPRGKWSSATGRIMLLGDAAHAMPPQGEATGIALEDAILFARVLAKFVGSLSKSTSLAPNAGAEEGLSSEILVKACLHYEALRQPRINAAYDDASKRWETLKDSGWLAHRLKSWLTPWFLWWTETTRRQNFEENIATGNLGA